MAQFCMDNSGKLLQVSSRTDHVLRRQRSVARVRGNLMILRATHVPSCIFQCYISLIRTPLLIYKGLFSKRATQGDVSTISRQSSFPKIVTYSVINEYLLKKILL